MIEPSSINLQTLSSVSFNSRSRLPKTPCIYFVIDKQGVVQYIGQSINPKQRWSSHHKRTEVEAIPGARIAYLQVDADLLLEVVSVTLALAPQLNRDQAQQATSNAETKYLVDVNRDSVGNKDLSQINAITPNRRKLKYGHMVCEALDEGATIGDLRRQVRANAMNNPSNDARSATYEILYFSMMRSSAIYYLCPGYNALLNQ